MIGRLLSFAAVSVLLWLLIALPARAAWGDATVLASAVALAVCLLPALGSLAWVMWSWTRPVETQFVAGMGGTGIRLFGVVAVSIGLVQNVPFLAENGFVPWVVLLYLLTLGLEVGLLLWAWPTGNTVSSASAAPMAAASATPRVD